MKHRYFLPTGLGGWLLAGAAVAQSPNLTSLSPTRNALAVPLMAPITVRFDQPLSNGGATLAALKVFSSQAGGQKAGTPSVSGNTLRFAPNTAFKPGETVQVTLTAAAQSSSGQNLATPQVFQFTTATAPSTGTLLGGSLEINLGRRVTDVKLGDLDGDGDLDLISDSPLSNSVTTRLNNGSGTFLGGQSVAVGTNPSASTLADVDGDGDLDILSANQINSAAGSTVSVRLNNGAGIFSGTQDVPVGAFPTGLVTGDVDGDGDLDLLTTNNTTTVSIRLNDGAGLYSGTQQALVGGEATLASLKDVDGDGDLDLLTLNFESGLNSTLSVRLNNGRGSFSGTQNIPLGRAWTLDAGDIDADGDLDIVVANLGNGDPLNILRNDGAGNFTSTLGEATPSSYEVALRDMDGDGDLDVVSADYNQNTVSVRLNNGAGTFSNSRTVAVGQRPSGLAIGDVDGDGDLDVLTPNTNAPGPENGISVRLNSNHVLAAAGQRAQQISLYPNPARGTVQLAFPTATTGPKPQADLYNLLGQCVRQFPNALLGAQPTTLDVSGLAPGHYLLRLLNGTQQVTRTLVLE